MNARRLSSPDILESRGSLAREAERELLVSGLHHDQFGLMRGLMIAIVLSVPFWVLLYLLLR